MRRKNSIIEYIYVHVIISNSSSSIIIVDHDHKAGETRVDARSGIEIDVSADNKLLYRKQGIIGAPHARVPK